MKYLGYYLFVKLDTLCMVFTAMSIISIILIGVTFFVSLFLYSSEGDKSVFDFIKKYKKNIMSYIFIIFSLAILTPTSKQAAFIVIAPEIVENGEVKDTFKNIPELTKLGTEYLKETLKEKVNERN